MENISEDKVPSTAVTGAQSTPKPMTVATVMPHWVRVSSSMKYGTMYSAMARMPPMYTRLRPMRSDSQPMTGISSEATRAPIITAFNAETFW
ncbi:hypothetical protein D3C76_1726420 [compost metagenome]